MQQFVIRVLAALLECAKELLVRARMVSIADWPMYREW